MAFFGLGGRRKPQPLTDFSIVLDLDSTLIYCLECDYDDVTMKAVDTLGVFSDKKLLDIRRRSHLLRLHDACTKRGEGDECSTWVIERPHLKEFLIFCFEYFRTVNVWTAGDRVYGEEIARSISQDIFPFDHILTQEDCVVSNGVYYKPLQKAQEIFPNIGPVDKIFFLDDNPDSFAYDPDNGILIPPYSTTPNVDAIRTDDVALLQFKNWLPRVKKSADVRMLDKRGIFTS